MGMSGGIVLDLDGLLRFAVGTRRPRTCTWSPSGPRLRVDGRLREAPFDTVEPTDTERFACRAIPPGRADEFAETNECDFMYGIVGLGRFRVSAFLGTGLDRAGVRRVLPGILSFEALGLPPAVATLAAEQHGIVLVTGLAGSGKTSTLAAMVDHVKTTAQGTSSPSRTRSRCCTPTSWSIVDQREVGTDTHRGRSGLEQALRQDPDASVLGELRDADAAWAVLQAAEIGHLGAVGDVDGQRREHRRPVRRAAPPQSSASGAGGIVVDVARDRVATAAPLPEAAAGSRRSRCSS